jgi:excisionase family DNA binding protein
MNTHPNNESPAATPSLLDELMTVEQVADKLRMKKSTVEDYRRRGLLPGFKLGRHIRFRRSEIERAIERLSEQPHVG